MTARQTKTTVILAMAVLLLGLGGCPTKQPQERLKEFK